MNNLDLTIDQNENNRFRVKFYDILKVLEKRKQFSTRELQHILLIYHKLCLNNKKSAEPHHDQVTTFIAEHFGVTDPEVFQFIFDYFAKEGARFTPESWVDMFDIMMSTDLEKKMRFVFQIYLRYSRPAMHDNVINREVITKCAEKMFHGSEDDDEVVELRLDMVDTLFAKFDLDRDGIITFEEYKKVVRRQKLLLEFLGPCLPNSPLDRNIVAVCCNIYSKLASCYEEKEKKNLNA